MKREEFLIIYKKFREIFDDILLSLYIEDTTVSPDKDRIRQELAALIDKKNPNSADAAGNTLLHLVVMEAATNASQRKSIFIPEYIGYDENTFNILVYLIHLGLDAGIKNKAGQTAIDIFLDSEELFNIGIHDYSFHDKPLSVRKEKFILDLYRKIISLNISAETLLTLTRRSFSVNPHSLFLPGIYIEALQLDCLIALRNYVVQTFPNMTILHKKYNERIYEVQIVDHGGIATKETLPIPSDTHRAQMKNVMAEMSHSKFFDTAVKHRRIECAGSVNGITASRK